jgi:hypothetical protein
MIPEIKDIKYKDDFRSHPFLPRIFCVYRNTEEMVAFASRMIMGFAKYKDRLDRHCLIQVKTGRTGQAILNTGGERLEGPAIYR